VDPELARIFTREAEKAIASLELYKGGNPGDGLQAYIMNVHALKGALGNIGEMELSGLARELEQAGREERLGFISEETPAFLDRLRALLDKLKPRDNVAGEVSDEDMEYLRKKLIVVKEACSLYDKKAAKAALMELKQKVWPGEYGELIDTIGEYLLHSDFDEAEATCAAQLSNKLGAEADE
jgi:HPt (histidine-containing phosphotransfer) domain-containing protein